MGCVLRQHYESGRKEQAIYYLSKKLTISERNYSMLEQTCSALAWAASTKTIHVKSYYMANFPYGPYQVHF